MTLAPEPLTAVSNPPVEALQSNLGPGDVVRRSATLDLAPPERQLTKVAKLIDVSKCIGCKACQSACIEWNDTHPEIEENVGSYDNPHDLTPDMFTLMRFTEYDNPETNTLEWLIRKDGCMHCEDPGCLKACPAPGAIVQYSNGIVDFIHENCIGCGYCVSGCPFDIPRISKVDHTAYKCTLCSDRVAVGEGPACAKACPTQCITFGPKEEQLAHAAERVEDLKSRGFENAGVYDPAGVGGTHVIYVLHHADKPEIYAGLPADPRISPVVEAWKGVTKTVGLAAIGVVAIGAALHGFLARANEVTPRDRENAQSLVDEESGLMRRVYSESGDRIAMRMPVEVRRYGPWTRANHWLTAACLILLLISGLGFFHPSLFFLTGLFGGGQTARFIHPWIGVALVVSFLGLFIRMARLNLPNRDDAEWLANAKDVISGHEENLPELGKYNAGQKVVFWSMTVLIVILVTSGLMMWEQYFSGLVSIPTRRIATIVHAIAAVLAACVWIMHVYAGIWTRGTISAMTRGTVTGGWAWRHHRKWLRELARLDRAGPAE